MKIISLFITIILLLFSFDSKAANIISSSAEYQNGRFVIKVVGVVDAEPQHIFAVLTDYNNLTQISPKIIESKILRKEQNAVVVRTAAKGCVWFFCRQIINTQSTTVIAEKNIQALTLPKESDLKFGKMVWNLKEDKMGTKIDYYAEIEPDFFVPPLIGGYFIKHSMLQEAKAFIDSVEKLAEQDID